MTEIAREREKGRHGESGGGREREWWAREREGGREGERERVSFTSEIVHLTCRLGLRQI